METLTRREALSYLAGGAAGLVLFGIDAEVTTAQEPDVLKQIPEEILRELYQRDCVRFSYGRIIPGTFGLIDQPKEHIDIPEEVTFPSHYFQRDLLARDGDKNLQIKETVFWGKGEMLRFPEGYHVYMATGTEAESSCQVPRWDSLVVWQALQEPKSEIWAAHQPVEDIFADLADRNRWKIVWINYETLHKLKPDYFPNEPLSRGLVYPFDSPPQKLIVECKFPTLSNLLLSIAMGGGAFVGLSLLKSFLANQLEVRKEK